MTEEQAKQIDDALKAIQAQISPQSVEIKITSSGNAEYSVDNPRFTIKRG